MLIHCLFADPIVRRRRRRRRQQCPLQLSFVFSVVLILVLEPRNHNQGRKTASSCFSAQAWQSQSLGKRWGRRGLCNHHKEQLLILQAYTEESGPRSVGVGGGYANQTKPLTPTPILRNGNSQTTPLPPVFQSPPALSLPPGIGTLGDIMSSAPSTLGDEEGEEPVFSSLPLYHHSGLVTSSSRNETLAAKFGITHPLDRMALTANGNLQRLFSSYYDAPVFVHVDYCQARDADGIVWDRVVHLNVHEQTFCTATSVITVNDDTCRRLVQSGQVGLGQLFRYLDLLPQFELQQAGRHDDDDANSNGGGWWRIYELKCRQVHCHIREDFCAHLWDIEPR